MPEIIDLLKRAFTQLINDVESLHGLLKTSNEQQGQILMQLKVLNQRIEKIEGYQLVLAENIVDAVEKLDSIRAYTGTFDAQLKHEILMDKLLRNHESD